MDIINGRYKIEKTIEIDSESSTFEVFDEKHQSKKILRLYNKGVVVDKTYKIFEDFLTYTKSEHQNILSNYNMDVIKGNKSSELQYFYTKEYIDNEALLNYVDLSYNERIYILESILYALLYLHFKGIVYGSLSFSNVFITRNPEGSLNVKLEDLASVILDSKSKNLIKKDSMFYVSGVETYNINKQADIYSIGMMTYYLLTGKDYHKEKIDYDGLQTLDYNMAELISKSIHLAPEKRPKSILEFWKKANRSLKLKHDFIDKKYYEYLDFSSSFVVHKEKRNELLDVVSNYFKGEEVQKAIFVRSKTGMGKSRFLSEIRHFSRISGFRTFLIEARDIVSGNYANIKYLLERILSSYEVPSHTIEKYGPDLLHLVPEYETVWDIKPSKIDNPVVFKNRIISRFLSLIERLSAEYNFIIMVDNVDKVSQEELAILLAILQSDSKNSPYLVLSASDMPAQFSEKEIMKKYSSIELKPFNYYDTVYYIKRLLNIGEEAKEIAKSISGICHGNPRKIENIILFMHKIGRIKMTKQRKWKIKQSDFSLQRKDLKNINLYDIDLALFDARILKLSADAVYILKQLAVFSQQVDVFFALQFSGLGGKRFMQAIDELITSLIVQKTTSDWGNYYEFSDYRFANIFYNSIPLEERVKLHKEIAKYYESKDFDIYEAEFDSYVLHLIKSNQNDIAIKSLREKAERKSKNLLYNEAIEYYEYALSIIKSEEMPREKLDILESISNVFYRLGKVKKAEEYYYRLIRISDKLNEDDVKYLSYEKILELYIFQNRIEEAKTIIDFLEQELNDYNNEMLSIRFEYLRLKLIFRNQENQKFLEDSEKFIEYLRLISNEYYLGIMLLGQAYYYIDKYDYDTAEEKATEALNLLIKHNKFKGLIFAYRLLGVIHLNKYNLEESREFFKKSFELAESMGLVWENSRLLVDIGDYYLANKDYLNAKRFYQSAEKYASRSNEISPLMVASIAIARVNMLLNEQSVCKIQLDKYADLFENNKNTNLKIYYYENLLVKAAMLLELRSVDESEKLLDEIEANSFDILESLKILRVRVLRVLLNYFRYLNHETDFDFEQLNEVVANVGSKKEKILLSEFLLDLSIDSYLNEELDIFNFAYDRVSEINIAKKTSSILYRRDFCKSLRENNIKELLSYIEHIKYNEFNYSWKIYSILAGVQFDNKEYVKALVNYIEARGQFFEKMQNVPLEHRQARIDMDVSLNKICNSINYLSQMLYGMELTCSNLNRKNMVEKDNSLVMQKVLAKIIKDREYKKYCKKIYENKFDTYIENWQKFITTIDEDNRLNLEKLIKFLVEYSFAQYGCLFLASENGELVEAFSTDLQYEAEIIDYISSTYEKTDVYIEEKTWDLSISSFGRTESTRMFFPVYLKEKGNLYTRRQNDEVLEYKELVAYVYLESDRVVHNINLKTYKNIKAYEPLISLLINDYNVTKKVTIDSLTQTHVRSYVQNMVQKTIEKSLGVDLEFSVLMIDIDHFKDVNDTYGHTRGDEVLNSLASILKSSVRESDIVGRYGGEEFVVILNGANKAVLKQLAEKIRLAVENAKLLGNDRALTISIGCSSYPQDGKNLAVLIENADKALYQAKNTGKNRVCEFRI